MSTPDPHTDTQPTVQRIAIVGSRGFRALAAVRSYVAALPAETIIVTGGAKGVDKAAEEAARAHGLEVIVHLPEWHIYGPKAGPIRNARIVRDADKLVAFWDGESHGTRNSIELARTKGIPVEVKR